MDWKNIKDGFPELMGSYICLMRDGHDKNGLFGGFFVIATFHKYFKDKFYSRCEDITDDVTHWMPLPEFPDDQ